MASFLERITDARRQDAVRRAALGALDEARAAVPSAPPPRDFAAALAAPGMSLIAEVKRSSPSAGAINAAADPVAQARAYEAGGARAISVLTEPDHFGGSLDDLRAVRRVAGVPVLRKDFIVEPLQVWEARAAGADAVLLIVAALEQTGLVALYDLAESLGMAALVEVHDVTEMWRAREAGARIVGINTRNLATLEVDPDTVKQLRPLAPDGALVVGESGVKTREDVSSLEQIGCDAVLVGEALMRAADPAAKIRDLLGG
ncbi:MAG: indole-3-glycerol phosphate synthase TrpC [Actinobacteria bacterium]|nr:indole-3-glycerol phosphate synthase TrpC [Actinomycetota bacterium]